MKVTRYSGYAAQCVCCGRRFRTATALVLDQVLREHEQRCAQRLSNALASVEARARQGSLF
jgi:hypothetical protein